MITLVRSYNFDDKWNKSAPPDALNGK